MEIKVFYDKKKTSEVKGDIAFKPVKAGESTSAILYIQNDIEFPVDINISLKGDNIAIKNNITKLDPNETKELVLELNPKITTMKPITAKLTIDLTYVVR